MLRLLDWTMIALAVLEVAVTWGCVRWLAGKLVPRGSWLAAGDKFIAWDKLDHLAWSVSAFAVIRGVGIGGIRAWILFALIAYGVEVVELGRFTSWVERRRPAPRPIVCDGISWKDLVWDVTGAVIASVIIARLR